MSRFRITLLVLLAAALAGFADEAGKSAPAPPMPERSAGTPVVAHLPAAVTIPPDASRAYAERAFDAQFRGVFDELILPNGLVLDRRSDRTTVSCAATGFTAFALARMVERGSAERDEVLKIVRAGFSGTLAANPPHNRGWLSHFTDAQGHPKSWSEVSSIDSAIFYLGFRSAARLLGEEAFTAEVEAAIVRVDQEFLLRDGYFLHGWHWKGEDIRLLPYLWDDSSEGVMLYQLFGRPFTPRIVRHDYPLFVYYYPLCFFDDPTYTALLRDAVAWQIDRYGYTGITAGDGPQGYQVDDPNVISPLALFALSALVPAARTSLIDFGVDHMVPAYHVGSGWSAPDRVTIDYASAYLLLVKPRAPVELPLEAIALPPLLSSPNGP